MKSKILGIAGKKQSGKDTIANYLVRNQPEIWPQLCGHDQYLYAVGGVPERAKVNIYSFAYDLKKVCMLLLGLTNEQCYGTDEQKNSLSNVRWQDFPGFISGRQAVAIRDGINSCKSVPADTKIMWLSPWDGSGRSPLFEENGIHIVDYRKNEYMTAREVLQYVGTEIFRRMNVNCWVDAALQRIEKEDPYLAIIPDARFITEFKSIQENGGKIIRLTRNIAGADGHISEMEADSYTEYDEILDNKDMSITEQNEEVVKLLRKWGW